jgi:hypothetical protein
MNKKVSILQFLVAGMLVFTMTMAFSQPVRASHTSVAIVAIPSESNAAVYSITRVYSEPDDASRVIDVLSPGTHFNILGFNASSSFIEIAKEGKSAASGWVASSLVSRNHLDSSALYVTKAYLQPSSTGLVASIITPGAGLQVLGHSVDGAWMAIENPLSIKTPIYWVASSDIRLPDVIAQTASLVTKFYLRPDTSSRITNVLPPSQNIALIGQIRSGGWYAVADIHTNKFFGWAQSNDLTGGMNKELLPVIPVR